MTTGTPRHFVVVRCRTAILRHTLGLAARPPVRYSLKVERRGLSTSVFRASHRVSPRGDTVGTQTYEVRPIGHVESPLTDANEAPKQGYAGAPDAWLVIDPEVLEGIRDIRAGDELLVLTWLHKSRRDELATHPQGDLTKPELGVFSTRSPARPNPIGVHRVSVRTTERDRLQVRPLEAVDGTPIVDIKPVIADDER